MALDRHCCTDAAGGAAGRAGVAGRPLTCPRMPSVPFKLNQDRRHHIPRQKRKVTNWREYDAGLRQRGSLTVWFTDDAVQAWQAEPRTTRGGQLAYSPLATLTALTVRAPGVLVVFAFARPLPPAVPADQRPDRLGHRPAWAGPRRARPHRPMPQ